MKRRHNHLKKVWRNNPWILHHSIIQEWRLHSYFISQTHSLLTLYIILGSTVILSVACCWSWFLVTEFVFLIRVAIVGFTQLLLEFILRLNLLSWILKRRRGTWNWRSGISISCLENVLVLKLIKFLLLLPQKVMIGGGLRRILELLVLRT